MRIKPSPIELLVISFLLLSGICYAQQKFDNYIFLKSEGEIPVDFSSTTYSKIDEKLTTNSTGLPDAEARIFLNEVHYGIDNLLHSGKVIYGDPVSRYVREVADKLLVKEPDLSKTLRFYTIKSNVANAFSTDQGIIFVTTGLISQLTSEAQLAYVLSHEIAHYTEKHVIQGYKLSTEDLKNGDHIEKLSIYSKEKELEADNLGLKRYYEAGYSKNDLMLIFDVLLYSYLPFEDIEFPVTYFNTDQMYVPEQLFPSQEFPIKAIEDYDDSKSSHPNIKKRKIQVQKEIELYDRWGDSSFLVGREKFYDIRTICRFESIRTDIIDHKFSDAIYSVFLLEQVFPNSIYLKRMKAHAWLGLAQSEMNGNTTTSIGSKKEFEGEIASLKSMLSQLNRDALLTLGLRQVYDLYKANPEDHELLELYRFFLKHVVSTNQFHSVIYFDYSFEEAVKRDREKQQNKREDATVQEDKPSSKYEKIKSNRNTTDPKQESFDSTRFYFYGIPDILSDSIFIKALEVSRKKSLEKESDKVPMVSFSAEEEIKIGKQDFIIVEPLVFCFKKQTFDLVKSEKLRYTFSDVISGSANEADVNVHLVDRNHINGDSATTLFNERSVLFSFLEQTTTIDQPTFPVDYQSIGAIKLKYHSSSILFTMVEHHYKHIIGPSILVLPFYPIASFAIPLMALKRNDTEMTLLVLDLNESEVSTGYSYQFNDKPRKYSLGAHMFYLFQLLSNQPN